MSHTIKIENITDDDYRRLQWEAATLTGEQWLREIAPLIATAIAETPMTSARNYVRVLLRISPAKRGNPHGNEGRRINQPKGKKRGVRRTKEELAK